MVRNEGTKTTIYEIVFPAHSLGQEMLTSGFSFGLSIVVNEGDMNGAAPTDHPTPSEPSRAHTVQVLSPGRSCG